jgi:hypothetical protein
MVLRFFMIAGRKNDLEAASSRSRSRSLLSARHAPILTNGAPLQRGEYLLVSTRRQPFPPEIRPTTSTVLIQRLPRQHPRQMPLILRSSATSAGSRSFSGVF